MFDLEFGTVGERMDRLEEACQIIRSLWTEKRTTFDGRHYRIVDAIGEPKPVQQPYPPIWIGGNGRKRTLRIVAQYADVWNAAGGTPDEVADLSAVLDQHCADVGRDPAQIRRTVQVRLPDRAEDVLPLIEDYARVGVTEVIVIVMGVEAVQQAEQAAELLPRLRAIG
jgi:alkanesulfonate monooxygenase SsuD/methylene tetrahydromethanopterin reductase-like flavin-dependent oxidoreductase (luciferase family)